MVSFDISPGPKSLRIWAYAIGCFDLIAALLFFVVGLRSISQRLSWLTIFGILFGIFWISMIVMLLLGIQGRRPRLVRAWIIFSCAGILTEIFVFLYGILCESSFHKGLVKNGLLLLAALSGCGVHFPVHCPSILCDSGLLPGLS
ncbi:uncharacterized protein [Drosophila kikkawai]|uniref:Uncharacterized protein isoform X2 n=1 Tax=Drosophila kikkawai TaxID=30033 RepID=A0ABM3C8B6_DROKI|nr:uncharacterized protein LOC108071904 isoform X2 [Drosophila kikkawai]